MLSSLTASEQLNALISEAFVQFFVRLVGHYTSHIKWSKNGPGTFQERAFCKAITSKTNRRFVKKFVKTNMFSLFIEDAEKSRIPQEGKGGCRVLGWREKGRKCPIPREGCRDALQPAVPCLGCTGTDLQQMEGRIQAVVFLLRHLSGCLHSQHLPLSFFPVGWEQE